MHRFKITYEIVDDDERASEQAHLFVNEVNRDEAYRVGMARARGQNPEGTFAVFLACDRVEKN